MRRNKAARANIKPMQTAGSNMKRFMLFVANVYYPLGGAHDLRGTFDSLADAMKAYPSAINPFTEHFDWALVFDCESLRIVAEWCWELDGGQWRTTNKAPKSLTRS